MPTAKELMTWEQTGLGRWVKKHKKQRYRVGVKRLRELYPDLVSALTRAGSRRAADQWWTDQQRELRLSESPDAIIILRILLEEQESYLQQARQIGDATLVGIVEQRIRVLRCRLQTGQPIKGVTLDREAAEEFEAVVIPNARKRLLIEEIRQEHRDFLWKRSDELNSILPVDVQPSAKLLMTEN